MGNPLINLGGGSFSIDASSANLKMVVGNYNRKSGFVMIDKFTTVPLESETIADGVISDQFGVVMALKNALAKLDVTSKQATLTVEGSYLHTRDLDLPAVQREGVVMPGASYQCKTCLNPQGLS